VDQFHAGGWISFGAVVTYPAGAAVDPAGPASGEGRVIRGGSWVFVARLVRSANRFRVTPAERSDALGFRPSRSLP
jgi:formylglycine-generating enzyme required for sulfatase activity